MQTFGEDEDEQNPINRVDIWDVAAACLPVVAVLTIAGSVAQVWGLDGVSTRYRLFIVAQTAGLLCAILALAAVAIVAARQYVGSGRTGISATALMAAGVVAVVTFASGVYLIWYALTLHVTIPGPNSTETFALGLGSGSWANRLAVTLPALATIALALTAFVAANRQLAAGRERAPLGPEGVNARQRS